MRSRPRCPPLRAAARWRRGPVGLVGTDAVQPPGQRLPRVNKPVTIRFGAPVWLGPDDNRRELRTGIDDVMDRIAALCGYVDLTSSIAPILSSV